MEVVFLGSVCDEAGIFIIQKKSTSGLDRGRSGTLQRDSNNVPVTGKDICSDFAEINNRVSSQTVMMTSGKAAQAGKAARLHRAIGILMLRRRIRLCGRGCGRIYSMLLLLEDMPSVVCTSPTETCA